VGRAQSMLVVYGPQGLARSKTIDKIPGCLRLQAAFRLVMLVIISDKIMQIWITLIAMLVVDCAANLLVAQGMKRTGKIKTLQPRRLLITGRKVLRNPRLWLSFLFQGGTFVLLLTLLSRANLSFITPLASSSTVINTLGARFVLKEQISPARWIGTLLICMGVILVSMNSAS
jgi:bacterial/archaeal transporter family protein